jgi:hypothetical protein
MNPPDSHWVSQTLTPYLRYAFNHALSYDADLTPQVHRAINICMHQPVRDIHVGFTITALIILLVPPRR